MTYVAVIDYRNGISKEFENLDNAISFIRSIMETDPAYHFAGTTPFRWQSHGPNASKAMQVKFIYIDEDGVAHNASKTIRIKDLKRGSRHKESHWDEVVAMFK